MTTSNHDRDKIIPGYIEGSLINILQFDKDMLSEYGLKIAQILQQMNEEDAQKLREEAKKFDELFDNK